MIAPSDDPRIRLAHHFLGTVDIAPDPVLPPRVVRLVAGDGRHFIAKQHAKRDRYAGELHAYGAWGVHLSGHAPKLVGRDDAALTLLLTAFTGDRADTVAPGSPEEELAHHAAGHVLGKLHRATSMPQGGAVGAALAERFQRWIDRAVHADLLDAGEENLLKDHAVILDASHMDSAVCHLDYQPRNWLLGDTFGICDFEHMRRDARVRDFARLEFRRWHAAPHLRTAFFDGYGRPPNDTERHLMESFGAIEAATALVKGHQESDPALSAYGRTVLSRLT
ncbi:aminoglycoside phosphotransferase family protein [Streptomyces sp. ICN988]|uniref:aminoglycoside phosphotransferase family protein n=1 Tax=Streptomyces sp. ICN988 TaxID=2983765 RepID=UPI0021E449C3|nr:aminoglycoside phosphotransferase family protein [Streptomyces sp. ICN988]MCV2458268.1 aminoglycoside phosphotransferase family protein [Streptomyces sp. ICN988]